MRYHEPTHKSSGKYPASEFWDTYRADVREIGEKAWQATLSGDDSPIQPQIGTEQVVKNGKQYDLCLERILNAVPVPDQQFNTTIDRTKKSDSMRIWRYTGDLSVDGCQPIFTTALILQEKGKKVGYVLPEGNLLSPDRVEMCSHRHEGILTLFDPASRFRSYIDSQQSLLEGAMGKASCNHMH